MRYERTKPNSALRMHRATSFNVRFVHLHFMDALRVHYRNSFCFNSIWNEIQRMRIRNEERANERVRKATKLKNKFMCWSVHFDIVILLLFKNVYNSSFFSRSFSRSQIVNLFMKHCTRYTCLWHNNMVIHSTFSHFNAIIILLFHFLIELSQ